MLSGQLRRKTPRGRLSDSMSRREFLLFSSCPAPLIFVSYREWRERHKFLKCKLDPFGSGQQAIVDDQIQLSSLSIYTRIMRPITLNLVSSVGLRTVTQAGTLPSKSGHGNPQCTQANSVLARSDSKSAAINSQIVS